ncbi:phage tail protein [Bordetella bronchiseptica]|nr:phage tail protein [Bordetella bronchiseptica OSU553]
MFSVSTGLGAAVAVSAITNANPAVASATSPPKAGTILIMKSGWPELNERVVRAVNTASNTFALEGIDTTKVGRFSKGQGIGTATPVSTWVDLSQVTNVAKTGGEQQFYQWRYVEDRNSRQRQRPTYKSAKFITLTLDYDPALAWYEALKEADAAKDAVVLRAKLPNHDELYYLVYPSFDSDPSMELDVNMQNTATFSMMSDFTRYAPLA